MLRWATLAMVATTLLLAVVGHPKLHFFDQKGVSFVTRSTEGAKISVLAHIMGNYTNKEDAIKTARRYHAETDDPELWTAMTIVESKCKSSAVSSSGAQGKLQVMPFWKKKPGFEFYRGKKTHLDDNLNFRAAHKVYTMLLNRQKGDKWRAVERYCGTGPDARMYVAKVKRVYNRIKAATEQAELHLKQGGAGPLVDPTSTADVWTKGNGLAS